MKMIPTVCLKKHFAENIKAVQSFKNNVKPVFNSKYCKDSIFLFHLHSVKLVVAHCPQTKSISEWNKNKSKNTQNPVSSGRILTSLLVFLPLDGCLNTRSRSTLTKWVEQSVFFLNTVCWLLSFPCSLCFPPGPCRQRHSRGKWHQHLLWSHDL